MVESEKRGEEQNEEKRKKGVVTSNEVELKGMSTNESRRESKEIDVKN